ncbi:Predicted NTP pyrophosphohydrolase, NUDIX family [Chitinophaga sp. YR573]|uniref:NUDIX domain-containing protein n=1 Tax=Chitinophaga sp. YR573 TaxID=1881040 RepID=UPI0008BA886D|nr:NUDIX domain-containing protein [Chitinophaga sp. YR573]SEW46516.1 Predicted NTP pyrophosphohydrolase, NUDIX family [Chitinophaga sp. YR573]
MAKTSSGILLYRKKQSVLEVLLVHPGGPFFARKDEGSWTIPKGELMEDEDSLEAAIREFEEETGYKPSGDFIPLNAVKQKGGKTVQCWAVEGDLDAAAIISNTFEMEWPPRSQKMKSFPEVDKASWLELPIARQKINERQVDFIDQLTALLHITI